MMPDRDGAGFLLGETARLLRVNPILALAALGAMTAVGVVSDMFADYAPLVGLASIPVNLVLQFQISLALLVHYDLDDRDARPRRLAALLGLNLLSGITILFGLILLIVPGLYLLVRWWAAAPALIAEEADVTQSLRLSAELVAGRFWHVFAAIMVVCAPGAAGLVAAVSLPESEILIASLVLNLFLNLSLISGWHLAVAIYAGRRDGTNLAEVFA